MAQTQTQTPTPVKVKEGGETAERKCLIAYDGSEHATYALEWYFHNIHRDTDKVLLVHVPELNDMLHSSKWSNSVYVFDKDVMEAMLKEEQHRIRRDLDTFAEKLRQHHTGGKVKSVMATKPAEGILKAARDEDVALIVVGSRGQSALRRTLMGSVSDYLVHHSHVPVFVCKHPGKHVSPEDMAAVTDIPEMLEQFAHTHLKKDD